MKAVEGVDRGIKEYPSNRMGQCCNSIQNIWKMGMLFLWEKLLFEIEYILDQFFIRRSGLWKNMRCCRQKKI